MVRNYFLNEQDLPGYVYRVKVLINLYLWYNYTERRVGVSCSVYDMLHTDAKGYIIMCKLAKLAFCLCCGLIDPSNVSVAVGIRQLILQHSLNC